MAIDGSAAAHNPRAGTRTDPGQTQAERVAKHTEEAAGELRATRSATNRLNKSIAGDPEAADGSAAYLGLHGLMFRMNELLHPNVDYLRELAPAVEANNVSVTRMAESSERVAGVSERIEKLLERIANALEAKGQTAETRTTEAETAADDVGRGSADSDNAGKGGSADAGSSRTRAKSRKS